MPHHPRYFVTKTLLKKYQFGYNNDIIYLSVCFLLVPAGVQKCSLVRYTSKHGAGDNLVLHFGRLNFFLVALFVEDHARHPILFPSRH